MEPGQVYSEVSDETHRAFDVQVAFLEGPVSDRWGTWVSALIPLIDPVTGGVIVVAGMGNAAGDWKWDVDARAALPMGLLLALPLGFTDNYMVILFDKRDVS